MSLPRQIHLVLGHGDTVLRVLLRQTISRDPSFIVDGEASDGQAALKIIEKFLPSLAILDVALPGKSGGEIAKVVRRRNFNVGVILLADARDEERFNVHLNYGVKGYLLTGSVSSDLLSAIREVAAGRTFVSPPYEDFLTRRERLLSSLRRSETSIGQLTPIERKVLLLIAGSMTTRQIAAKLALSEKTVENHRTNIAQKLGLSGGRSVVKFAAEYKSIL